MASRNQPPKPNKNQPALSALDERRARLVARLLKQLIDKDKKGRKRAPTLH